jgi:glutamate synthase domain-containing protein 1
MKTPQAIQAARMSLVEGLKTSGVPDCEGGCGVIGIVGTEPLPGKLIIRPCAQMRNRGNGKGGGVAAAGLFPQYKKHYALHIGYLDEGVRKQLEDEFITSRFEVALAERQNDVGDHRSVGLELKPPLVWRYFVRAKQAALERFMSEAKLTDPRAAEDEFVYQNSFKLNRKFYAEAAPPQAFVLSHGRDLMILKAVGYAEEVARFYRLEETRAQVWIGHQRYPTRGRVWHPGGAHPFAGLHEALVHNGDFANYHAVTEYLRQRGMVPLFVTDTEVAVLLFDHYARVLGYPLEHVIEALGPTPEGDFERLSKRRQRIYRALQNAHLSGSPDGPWFFIVARCDPATGAPQLIGITDVSMLRPQVFSVQRGAKSFGAIASEKQAIDAFFEELSGIYPDVPACADAYWNARGGSCTDGGAFTFTAQGSGDGAKLHIADKFGNELFAEKARPAGSVAAAPEESKDGRRAGLQKLLRDGRDNDFLAAARGRLVSSGWREALTEVSFLRDRRWDLGGKRPGFVGAAVDRAITAILDSVPALSGATPGGDVRLDLAGAAGLGAPKAPDAALVLDARGFPAEGRQALSRLIVDAFHKGWKRFVVYRARGDRFLGCGLGPASAGVRMDVYGSSGDYLGSGLDGAEIFVHGNAQDQVGQILKSGRIVVYGDVGQTFLYGAKGGEAFVMGNAAGRPLINAVGRIRALINGTCLDYCAESFMAGDQLGGGFVIINGLGFNERGSVVGLELKYPGNNLFSLASGGACYLNDPYHTVSERQLNGASFVPFREADWGVIFPYLQANEELFGISNRYDLLVVDGVLKWPKEVFRKIVASPATKGLDWSGFTV